MANTTNTTKKTTTSSTKAATQPKEPATSAKAEYKAKLAALEKQNAELQSQLSSLMKMVADSKDKQAAPVMEQSSLNEEVRIVHLIQRASGLSTYIHLSTIDISMSAFGEERTLDRRQAEELVGKYRYLFDEGIIAFGAGNEELANRLSVKSMNAYGYIGPDFLNSVAEMSALQLEDLYKKVCDGHKTFLVEYFKRKNIEKDPRFMDPSKIDVLNRLSGRAMFDVLLDRERDEVNAAKGNK